MSFKEFMNLDKKQQLSHNLNILTVYLFYTCSHNNKSRRRTPNSWVRLAGEPLLTVRPSTKRKGLIVENTLPFILIPKWAPLLPVQLATVDKRSLQVFVIYVADPSFVRLFLTKADTFRQVTDGGRFTGFPIWAHGGAGTSVSLGITQKL